MVDINAIERALLIGVVRQESWKTIVLNGITEEYFTFANKSMFQYIEGYVNKGQYPEIPIMQYEFEITDDELAEYLAIKDLQGLCRVLKSNHLTEEIQFSLGKLNQRQQDILTNPSAYVDFWGTEQRRLEQINYTKKSVNLFENIEEALTLDVNDVISTGFPELDEVLVGWRRGEELAVFVARPGQGKSWMGLKFAMSAAMKGEKVGIYSGEMSIQQLQERAICCAKKNYTDTKDQALQYIKEMDLNMSIVTQAELGCRATVKDIEEMIIRDELTMVVIDQLSFMDDISYKPGMQLRQTYGRITIDLFELSKRYGLPIILLAQSNRQGGQEARGPQLDNIAESDAVAQNATRVISMRNDRGILTMNVVKNRYGDADISLKYEVDYGINKYRPIKEQAQLQDPVRIQKAKSIFGGNVF